jgi:hypothetical protein
LVSAVANAAVPVATYTFNNTLAAVEAGAPALVSVDPLGLNQFEMASVNGVNQPVFHWDGSGDNPLNNAGLKLDTTGLVDYENYSVEMVFEFLERAQFGGGWRRIMDTQNRQSDNGFYVEPGNRLQVYSVVTGSTLFMTPGFHHVLLTNFVVGGTREVKAYLDSGLELTSSTDQLNLDNSNNPGHLLQFFLDNTAGPAELEYADGRIAYLRIYNGVVAYSADFDADGDVDGADFLTWQRGEGLVGAATHAQGDADGDLAVLGSDLNVWRTQFGQGLPVQSVPEPASPGILVVGVAVVSVARGTGRKYFATGIQATGCWAAGRTPPICFSWLIFGTHWKSTPPRRAAFWKEKGCLSEMLSRRSTRGVRPGTFRPRTIE